MTWTKLSDDFSDESWTLSDAAYRLQVEALNYSNRKLLDLKIPKEEMRRFAKRPEAAQELIDGGWWTDVGHFYLIVFQGAYQPSRDSVIKQKEANKRNGLKGGRPAKPGRETAPVPSGTPVSSDTPETHAETHSLSDSKTHGDGTGQDRAITQASSSNEFVEIEEGVWADSSSGEVSSAGQVTAWPVAEIGQGRKAS